MSPSVARGDAEHLVDPRELYARAAGGLAERALVAVDRGPAVVGDELGLALMQQLLDRTGVGGVGLGQALSVGGGVGEDRVDGLLGVLLVRADHAGGAALDPADGVLAGQRRTGRGIED